MKELVLEYKRVNVDRSTGRVVLKEDGSERSPWLAFDSVDFPTMLRAYARLLKDNEEAVAIWQRTDRPGLLPYTLDPQVADLFRTDIEAAIVSMSPDVRSPSYKLQSIQAAREVPAGLRAGFDTLADAFGDKLYVRFRDNSEIECPCCGMWGSSHRDDTFICQKACANRQVRAFLVEPSGRWAGFSAQHLLDSGSSKFYFPRAWNDGASWISREKLQMKLDEYNKEKSEC